MEEEGRLWGTSERRWVAISLDEGEEGTYLVCNRGGGSRIEKHSDERSYLVELLHMQWSWVLVRNKGGRVVRKLLHSGGARLRRDSAASTGQDTNVKLQLVQ